MINENNLSAVDKHKHLGIWIESSLRWDAHINYIVGKANRVLGLIRRTFGSKDPVPIKTAFIALVRPVLEYATLGSRGYFFLMDTDGSRRSRVSFNAASLSIRKKILWNPG